MKNVEKVSVFRRAAAVSSHALTFYDRVAALETHTSTKPVPRQTERAWNGSPFGYIKSDLVECTPTSVGRVSVRAFDVYEWNLLT